MHEIRRIEFLDDYQHHLIWFHFIIII